MDDLFRMMPHGKSDSKMQKKETLFAVNEIAEMKNCRFVCKSDLPPQQI
jgi:ribosome biogenesis protein BRX1